MVLVITKPRIIIHFNIMMKFVLKNHNICINIMKYKSKFLTKSELLYDFDVLK